MAALGWLSADRAVSEVSSDNSRKT